MQEYFLVSEVENISELQPDLPWLAEAKRRAVIVERPVRRIRGAGILINRAVVTSDQFFRYKKRGGNVLTTHTYPERVVSPACGTPQMAPDLHLTMYMPEYCPSLPLGTTDWGPLPEKGEILLIVNPLSGIATVKVRWSGVESDEEFDEGLANFKIDVSTGVPSSLMYRENGEIAGIAVTSANRGVVWALTGETLFDFYRCLCRKLPYDD